MKNFLVIFCLVFILSGCGSWIEIEDSTAVSTSEFRPQSSYEEYTSGYKTCDIGHCKVCGRKTSSGMIKYCASCWNGQGR